MGRVRCEVVEAGPRNRLLSGLLTLLALFAGALALAVTALGVGETTGTNTATAVASVPAQTISANGTAIATIAGQTVTASNTVTYALPTVTRTVTQTVTTSSPPAPLHQLWADGSFLNTPIPDSVSIDASSSTWATNLYSTATYGIWVDYQHWTTPIYYASAATGTASVRISNSGKTITIPYSTSFKPDDTGDAGIAIIDGQCLYEFTMFNPSTMVANAEGTYHIETGSGLHATDAGTTGSGISHLGGIITAQDVKDGVIKHALRYATPAGLSSSATVYPANRSDGGAAGGIPAGQLVRLDPTLDLATYALTPFQLMVAKALQTFGAYNADVSGSFKLYAESTIGGATYAQTPAPLPRSLIPKLQFLKPVASNVVADTNTDPTCNQQH